MKNSVKKLSEIISHSERIVVFTGAGISTQSGIPDFRGTNGLWLKYKPISFDEFMTSKAARVESWRQKCKLNFDLEKARPNNGHNAVAYLDSKGFLRTLITQNVDGLHQVSGVDAKKIIEIHGNATKAVCLECSKNFALDVVLKEFKIASEPPLCDQCGGFIKTATISFGQAMPQGAVRKADHAARDCDLFLVLGSSLVVYPAASLPRIAKDNGATLVIINHQPTDLDGLADLVIRDEIGDTLSLALGIN